jgi:flagellin-like protein
MFIGVFCMAFTRKNEEAVSPVIGVILMVAITVILAAVIAAFVFGMAGNIQKTHTVAATVARNSSTGVVVTYQGGQDANLLLGMNFTVAGNPATSIASTQTGYTITANPAMMYVATPASYLPVGASIYLNNVPTNSVVEAIGSFSDGSTQVILDTTV